VRGSPLAYFAYYCSIHYSTSFKICFENSKQWGE
jgi:hypothetical protein